MKVKNCNKVIILASQTPLLFSHLRQVRVIMAGSHPSSNTAGFQISQLTAIHPLFLIYNSVLVLAGMELFSSQ